jgi:UDP-N-acetylmuramoyl-tripeptide--D-alanyl-D-alanine ligase
MGKIKITIEDLFNIPGAVIYNPDSYKPLRHVEIDSRKIEKGSLFVAIKGEKYDGHDFILDALKKGAKAVVIDSRKLKKFSFLEIPLITVDDTIRAYGELAKIWRNKLSAKVIAITGSNGKTSVKEMISTLLENKLKVVKTESNNNNHIGVPLTIFSADEKCDVLILEHGTNHFNEIEYTANISRPDFALITNIGDSHLEFLKNREGVYREKSSLLDITEMHGGKVLLNTDDPIIKKYSKNYWNKISYGFNGKVDIKGKILGYTRDGKSRVQLKSETLSFAFREGFGDFTLPVYGTTNAYNFLAASAVAVSIGLSSKEIKQQAQKIISVHGRLNVKNYKQAVIIDDTYNSSPVSVKAAIDLVNRIKTFKRKIFVLGDMFELGKNAAKYHKDLAVHFSQNKNLFVLTSGNLMKSLNKSLRKKKIKSIHFHIREALALYLKYEEIENSVILVKGSRGMKMEEFVNILEKRFE